MNAAPPMVEQLVDADLIPVADHTRGTAEQIKAARDYIAHLNANREAKPMPTCPCNAGNAS